MDLSHAPLYLKIILISLGVLVIYQITARLLRLAVRFPAPAFIGFFLDSDVRRRLQPSEKIIFGAGIQPGMHVLEIGCGSGGYTTFLARAVGPKGHLDALDIQARMLAQVESKLQRPEYQDIDNVTLHQASAYQLPFEVDEIDLAIFITVLPEIPDQKRALAEVRRVLKPEGILAVSELLLDPDYPLRSATIRKGREAGFYLEGVYGNFWTYTVRFYKPG
jgi:ubiquinone/menaquinone biosynthesis C-methylase UbiE